MPKSSKRACHCGSSGSCSEVTAKLQQGYSKVTARLQQGYSKVMAKQYPAIAAIEGYIPLYPDMAIVASTTICSHGHACTVHLCVTEASPIQHLAAPKSTDEAPVQHDRGKNF